MCNANLGSWEPKTAKYVHPTKASQKHNIIPQKKCWLTVKSCYRAFLQETKENQLFGSAKRGLKGQSMMETSYLITPE